MKHNEHNDQSPLIVTSTTNQEWNTRNGSRRSLRVLAAVLFGLALFSVGRYSSNSNYNSSSMEVAGNNEFVRAGNSMCKKYCSKGQPCGDSCIAADKTCSIQSRGAACWAKEKCSKRCNKGKPCGDSCIAADKTCSIQERGTACWAEEKCTKFCSKGQACGNSCISFSKTCGKQPSEGFACNSDDYKRT